MTKIIPENKARQGRWGWHGLRILIAALLLAFIAWGIADGHACDGDIDAYQAWARVLIAITQTSDESPQEGNAVAGGLEARTRSA